MKSAHRMMVLDGRRVMLNRTQSEAMKILEGEKKTLAGQLKDQKKELRKANSLLGNLTQSLNGAQAENSTLRADNDRLRSDNDRLMKELADLQATIEGKLGEAEQKGYDLCLEENLASIKSIRNRLYQAGYDAGLEAAQVPLDSSLRTEVAIPPTFRYVVEEPAIEESTNDDADASITESAAEDPPVAVEVDAAVADDGREGGEATPMVEEELEDTGTNNSTIELE